MREEMRMEMGVMCINSRTRVSRRPRVRISARVSFVIEKVVASSWSYLQREHHFSALLRVHPVVTLHQDVTPKTKTAEVYGELASVRHGIEIRGVNGSQAFVDLEERSTTCRLEQRNTQNREMR